MKSSLIVAAATTSCAHAFVSAPASSRTPMSLNMGLFDGVKEAFGGDGMGDISSERETPIDRWMGWNAKSTEVQGSVSKGTFYCQIHILLESSVYSLSCMAYGLTLISSFNLLCYYMIQNQPTSSTPWTRAITLPPPLLNQWESSLRKTMLKPVVSLS